LVRVALARRLTGVALKQDEALALMVPPRTDQ
jgi:hypothetical protein